MNSHGCLHCWAETNDPIYRKMLYLRWICESLFTGNPTTHWPLQSFNTVRFPFPIRGGVGGHQSCTYIGTPQVVMDFLAEDDFNKVDSPHWSTSVNSSEHEHKFIGSWETTDHNGCITETELLLALWLQRWDRLTINARTWRAPLVVERFKWSKPIVINRPRSNLMPDEKPPSVIQPRFSNVPGACCLFYLDRFDTD